MVVAVRFHSHRHNSRIKCWVQGYQETPAPSSLAGRSGNASPARSRILDSSGECEGAGLYAESLESMCKSIIPLGRISEILEELTCRAVKMYKT